MTTTGVRVRVTDTRRGARRGAAAGVARWLSTAVPARARGVVTIALVSDAAMRRLNRTFRGIDRATDVLSFPAGDPPMGAAEEAMASARPRMLGDLAIAVGVARRQARREGHALGMELRLLALHGLLHLLGYDHETDQGAMARLEERLRRRAGLPAGLIGRAPRRTVRP